MSGPTQLHTACYALPSPTYFPMQRVGGEDTEMEGNVCLGNSLPQGTVHTLAIGPTEETLTGSVDNAVWIGTMQAVGLSFVFRGKS